MREVAELTRLGARLLTLTDERLLLIGDFNADSHEEPMLELRRAGFVDLMDAVAAETRYSYVFDGRAGLLDHAFAAPALLPLLVRAEVWHINADEAASRDYRLENPGAEYRADPWRCSDHDPIWIDLRL